MGSKTNQQIGARLSAASLSRPRGFTRRSVLKCGLIGGAAFCGGAAFLEYLLKGGSIVDKAAVFKGDAPTSEVWELWKKRQWVKEAYHYVKLGDNVQCMVCPNGCILAPGDRSRCRNKVNKEGILYTLAYANPCAFGVDPIEKKPLFHFLPGTTIFSLATTGCGFRCLNCQNWDISQRKPEEVKDPRGPEFRLTPEQASKPMTAQDADRLSLFPADAAAVAERLKCPSIAYTYSEPIAYYEYLYDTAREARKNKLRNVLVTCGYIRSDALEDLCQHIDAASVNLKSFSEEIYRDLNSGQLKPVMDTLVALKKRGVWFEVINLVVPTYTDRLDMIRRMCDWMVKELGPDCPLHFSRFHPAHKLDRLPQTPVEILLQAREAARQAGLRYVYIGNVQGVEGAETTFCPHCKAPIIERDCFAIRNNRVHQGKCELCQAEIAGVWS